MHKAETKLSITAEIRIKDHVDISTGAAEIDQFCQDMNSEPGCDMALAHQDKDDPRKFILWEVYRDQAAFDAHFKAEHTQSFFSKELTELKWARETHPANQRAAGESR